MEYSKNSLLIIKTMIDELLGVNDCDVYKELQIGLDKIQFSNIHDIPDDDFEELSKFSYRGFEFELQEDDSLKLIRLPHTINDPIIITREYIDENGLRIGVSGTIKDVLDFIPESENDESLAYISVSNHYSIMDQIKSTIDEIIYRNIDIDNIFCFWTFPVYANRELISELFQFSYNDFYLVPINLDSELIDKYTFITMKLLRN